MEPIRPGRGKKSRSPEGAAHNREVMHAAPASFGPSPALGFHPWRALSSVTADRILPDLNSKCQLWLQSVKSRGYTRGQSPLVVRFLCGFAGCFR